VCWVWLVVLDVYVECFGVLLFISWNLRFIRLNVKVSMNMNMKCEYECGSESAYECECDYGCECDYEFEQKMRM
jgi:hypothetical protein